MIVRWPKFISHSVLFPQIENDRNTRFNCKLTGRSNVLLKEARRGAFELLSLTKKQSQSSVFGVAV